MYRVEATAAAEKALSDAPELRVRVEEVLSALLETADELRKLQAYFVSNPGGIMRAVVAGHEISYTMDLNAMRARILVVQPTAARESSAA